MHLGNRLRRGVAASVACALAVGAGCGGPDRPPPPARGTVDAGTKDTFTATTPTVQSCNLGPDGGVCACADEPLLGDPPTLYFVLDRSGSMLTDNKWATIIDVLGDLVIELGPRAKVGAAVFPDVSDADACMAGNEVFSPLRGDSPAGIPGPAETALLQTLGHIGANGGTPTAATLQNVLRDRLMSLPGKTFVILATDGGPNCDIAASCDAAGCGPNIEGAPGCGVGGPNCCTPGTYGVESCLDAAPTEDAVKAIAAAGIPVYVVGVPGSAPYASLLDRLAVAGGTPAGGAHQYYDVSSADQSAFTKAIFAIAAKITGSCTLALGKAPPDPQLVNVFFDEKPLAQFQADGTTPNWTMTDTTVTVLGASCQKILDGTVLDVRVVAGCPTLFR